MRLSYRDKFLPAKGSNTHKIANLLNYKTIALICLVIGSSQLQIHIRTSYPSFELLVFRFVYITLALEIAWTVFMNFMNSFHETMVFRSVKLRILCAELPNSAYDMIGDYTYANQQIKWFWTVFGKNLSYVTIGLSVIAPIAVITDHLIAEVASLIAFATIRRLQVMRSLDIVRHNETIIMTEVTLSKKSK
jgi:hypothetical protein